MLEHCLTYKSNLTIQRGSLEPVGYSLYVTILHRTQVQLTAWTKIWCLLKWILQSPYQIISFNNVYAVKCYKLESNHVSQEMTKADKQALLRQLKSDYRQILIDYFTTDKTLQDKIDEFIQAVFYANIPVPQIIEIHMELIDEFSKQLKLEGRSDDALLDYRLTLIDILAHLCEQYRSSLPR